MATQSQEQRTPGERSEKDVDESVKESFPASDPPAVGGATRIEPRGSGEPAGSTDIPGNDKPEVTQPDNDGTGTGESGKEPGADEEEDEEGSEAPPNESSTEKDKL